MSSTSAKYGVALHEDVVQWVERSDKIGSIPDGNNPLVRIAAQVASTVVLHGPAGSGKTHLLRYFLTYTWKLIVDLLDFVFVRFLNTLYEDSSLFTCGVHLVDDYHSTLTVKDRFVEEFVGQVIKFFNCDEKKVKIWLLDDFDWILETSDLWKRFILLLKEIQSTWPQCIVILSCRDVELLPKSFSDQLARSKVYYLSSLTFSKRRDLAEFYMRLDEIKPFFQFDEKESFEVISEQIAMVDLFPIELWFIYVFIYCLENFWVFCWRSSQVVH